MSGGSLGRSRKQRRLLAVKVVHTIVWAFFAGCIVLVAYLWLS